MNGFKLTRNRDGHLHFNGLPTGVWIQKLSANLWRLERVGMPCKQYAVFSKRKFALQAANVFIEGMRQEPGETARNAAIRALWLCVETGSTSIVGLNNDH